MDDLAQALRQEISRYGQADVVYSTGLFSGERSKIPTLSGVIARREFKVLLFEASDSDGIPCRSAHFILNVHNEFLSDEAVNYWNVKNRFTKIYQVYDDTYLVMDTFIPDKMDEKFIKSAIKIWESAVNGISKDEFVFGRMRDL